MKKEVNIPEGDGRVYLGREILEEYEGDTDAFVDKACILIRNPKASLETLLKSIDVLKRDIKIRLEMGEK